MPGGGRGEAGCGVRRGHFGVPRGLPGQRRAALLLVPEVGALFGWRFRLAGLFRPPFALHVRRSLKLFFQEV